MPHHQKILRIPTQGKSLHDVTSKVQAIVTESSLKTGPDDMPAHIRSVLTQTSEQIPMDRGRLLLGTWQGIYLWEHRQMGNIRELVVHLIGE
jgi:thiamine phosphate synthase YjbQ (UPF0047 family)